MATTDKATTEKAQQAVDQTEVQQGPKTVENSVIIIMNEVISMLQLKRGMPDVRRRINVLINEYGTNPFIDKKELSKALRETFERFKQFAEATHQEVIMVTSQIGW